MKAAYEVYKPTAAEKRKYVLRNQNDREILCKCRKLEKERLADNDRDIVRLIKSQLLRDWRKPLLRELNKIIRKCK